MPDSHTIAENLTRLTTARTNIATAITTKGGTVAEGAGFEDFPTAIGTIPSGDDSFGKLVDGLIVTAVIPSGITKIRDYAFESCRSLTSVTVPNTVTAIGMNAFSNCTSLTAVNIPSGVTSILNYTFNNCTSLTSVTIPSGVTSILARAFNACTSLASIKFEPITPPTVGSSNAWNSVPTTCVIQVPTGSLTAYTSASNYPNPNTYTYVEY